MVLPLLLVLQSNLAAVDTARPVHDALHYDLTLVLGDTSGHIVGQIETTWRLRSRGDLVLDFDSTMRVVRVLVPGAGGGRRGVWFQRGGFVGVPHGLGPGDTMVTRIRFHGAPKDGLLIRSNIHGVRSAFADNWPNRAHHWFPLQDHPSDKATVSFHVEVPPGYHAIANGTLEKVDTLPRARTVWHYRTQSPIPAYTMVVGISRFAVAKMPDAACEVRCVPLALWMFPEDSAYAAAGPFRRAGEMLDYFSQMIGPFPYERLAHVQSSTIFGGMENATAIFYDEKSIAKHSLSEETVAHETAHQWFGDAVTEDDWGHLWLSEGFATYLAVLWVERVAGDSARANRMRTAAETIFASPVTDKPVVELEHDSLLALLNSNNYQKGAWVLHSLRGLIGERAFFAGLRSYYQTYRDSTALSQDFAQVMSAAAGQDLGWYFEQALTQPGYPILDVSSREEPGKGVLLTLRQVQKEAWGLYRIPGLEVVADGKRFSVDVTGRETRIALAGIRRRPRTVQVDPAGWWLLKVRSEK